MLWESYRKSLKKKSMKKRHKTRKIQETKEPEPQFLQDTDLFLQILIFVEKYGSLCPENLICAETHEVFSEAFRRFESWDKISERMIAFSNEYALVEPKLRYPGELVLDILKLENAAFSMREEDALEEYPELHRSVVFLFGSWTCGLSVAGITRKKYSKNE